jgi:peptidoglycan/xylan/chitin deacetylase (PgdA/CDA1 family)
MLRLRRPTHLRQRVTSRVRHGATTRTVVLLYHRVAEPHLDPQLLAVSPANFAEQLEVLSTLGSGLPLGAVLGARSGVGVTFDDGYADNLAAARTLAARELPATVFVAAGLLGQEPWWDTLGRLILASPALPGAVSADVGGERRRWELPEEAAVDSAWNVLSTVPDSPRTTLYRELFAALRILSADRQHAALTELAGQIAEPPAREAAILTEAEVEELVALDAIELGAHTCTHPVLSTLPAERQREEVVGAKARLEEVSGRSVSSFAYPFGSARDYDAATPGIVRAAGFARACINDPVPVRARADPFKLPRFVVRDWDGDTFEQHLRSWLRA